MFVSLSLFSQLTNASAFILPTGLRRESKTVIPLWKACSEQQVELCWNRRWCMPWHIHHLHTTAARRFRGFLPSLAALLAHSGGVWFPFVGLGIHSRSLTAEVCAEGKGEGYQGAYDV